MDQDSPSIAPPSDDAGYDLADDASTAPISTLTRGGPPPGPAEPPAPGGFVVDLAPKAAPTPISAAASGKAEAKVTKAKAPAGAGLAATLGGLLGRFARKVPTPAEPAAQGDGEGAAEAKPKSAGIRLRIRRRERSWRRDLPAWSFSTIVHLSLLSMLALATVAPRIKSKEASIDSAPVDTSLSEDMSLDSLVDPNDSLSDQAVSEFNTPGEATGLGTGGGAPSATPSVAGRGVGPRSLPDVNVTPQVSPVAQMPTRNAFQDLAGGGQIKGNVAGEVKDIGEALDRLAKEILRHLMDHKVLVVWVFDESFSMKDDQRTIQEKFDRVAGELKLNVAAEKKAANALTHAIVSYGANLHAIAKPTADIDLIGDSIEKIPVDETGVENTYEALVNTINSLAPSVGKDRRMLVVLVTDESGDDEGQNGVNIEAARKVLMAQKAPLYVIGRQSLFGYSLARLLYVDPITKDHYWPTITRGPETAAPECLQWDGLHDRWDEQPSGFAPYGLARLVKESGGIYFLLPSEEEMRVRQREKAYKMADLKEYLPDNRSRGEYLELRNASPLRATLASIIEGTRSFGFRRHFPVDYAELEKAMVAEYPVVEQRLVALLEIEKTLRDLKGRRDREPDKRWRAHYDLMLAQVVTYQIKAYEYRACLKEMVALAQKGQLVPTKMPIPEKLVVEWVLDHSKDRKAPESETAKKYAEAEALLKKVIADHPHTPWADLAQDELNRGFGVQRHEWHHDPRYNEREKLVPHY